MNKTPNIEDVYKNASSVDLEEQKRLWDERGKGYYGEYLVFQNLYLNLPGLYKILLNIEVPSVYSKQKTEIDVLLIHETGIYVFEVKHYKGVIYGDVDDVKWTQYFKTTSNSHFNNPVKQNEWHIKAINNILQSKDIYSYIVFTNPECELRIKGYCENTNICYLSDLSKDLISTINSKEAIYSLSDIERMFDLIRPYSKINNVDVSEDNQIISMADYINNFKNDYRKSVETIINKNKLINQICIVTALSSILICIIGMIYIPKKEIEAIENKYRLFFSKYEKVENITVNNIAISNLFEVTDINMEQSNDLIESVKISFSLHDKGNDYHLGLSDKTTMIIMTNSGKVKETSIYTDDIVGLKEYLWNLYRLQPGYFEVIDVNDLYISDLTVDEIDYIKLTNINIYKDGNINNTFGITEIEIYD